MSAVAASPDPRSDTPLLILEPHFDDAALSCASLLERQSPIDVVTVFAGEPNPPVRGHWDDSCGFTDSRQALAARRAEQVAAFAGLAHSVSELSLLEAQYLGGPRPRADADVLAEVVEAWAERNAGGLVALPAGAGWRAPGVVRRLARMMGRARVRPHEAHLWVTDAALEALSPDWTPLLYEELPYLFGGRADGAARSAARARGMRETLVELPVDRSAKARRIGAYASQVPEISPPGLRLDDPAALPAVERFWLLERLGEHVLVP